MKELQAVFEFTDSQLIARYGEEYEYQIESIKGPTEYNATGLPQGLEIDSQDRTYFRGSEPNRDFFGQSQGSQFVRRGLRTDRPDCFEGQAEHSL